MTKKQKSILGLDIGSYSIKITEAQVVDNELLLSRCQLFTLPLEKGLSSDFLKSILQKINLKNYRVIVSVQGQGVILRYLSLPKVNKDELKGALRFELEKNIPFSIDDVFIDGQIIKAIDDKVLVLAVAAKKKFIHDLLTLLGKSGIYPEAIDCNTIALANVFTHMAIENKKKTNAILNIGCSFTSLSILKEDLPLFNRDIPIGSSYLTKKIADTLNINSFQAESLKLNPKEKADEVRQISESVLEDLISEIKFSFGYFESKEDSSIDSVYVSGGFANFPGIDKSFTQAFNIECKFFDPFTAFKKTDNFDGSLMESSLYYPISLGLVLRGKP
jgi:type IV pilus assembly protein PilM